MVTPKMQVIGFLGGCQVNVCLPYKKYSPRGAYGASRRKVFFIIVGLSQWDLHQSGAQVHNSSTGPAPQWVVSCRVPSSVRIIESTVPDFREAF